MAGRVKTSECRLSGCHTFGAPNFTCSRCGKMVLYFCSECQGRLVSELKILGKMEVVCYPCIQEKSA